MFEVAKGQVIGKPLTDFIDRDSQDVFYHQRQQLPDMLAPRAFELQFRRSSSASFWGWVEIHAFRDGQGALTRRVAFTDITLLKKNEADRNPATGDRGTR